MQWYIDHHFKNLYENIEMKKLTMKRKLYGSNADEMLDYYDRRINAELRLLDKIFQKLKQKK